MLGAAGGAALEHEVQLLLVVLRSPVLRPVKLLTPKEEIPKWCLTGRYGAPPSSISSLASKRVTE